MMHNADSDREELQILLTSASPPYGGFVTFRRPGDGGETAPEPIGSFDVERLETGPLRRLMGYIERPPDDAWLTTFGRELAEIAFPPAARQRFVRECRSGLHAGPAIRFVVRDAALQRLPWELLFLDDPGLSADLRGFAALCPRFHLVREVAPQHEFAAVGVNAIRLLAAWADPVPRATLTQIDPEVNAVRAALKTPQCGNLHAHFLDAATPLSLAKNLERCRPNVLHFIGHGAEGPSGGYLLLESDRAGAHNRLYADDFAAMLAGSEVRLVVLSACGTPSSTHRIASTLANRGVAAVVGMQLPLRDSTMGLMMSAFYSALAQPATVEEAVSNARRAVRGAGLDWAIPALYLAGKSGRLFTAPAAEPPFTVPYTRNPHFVGREAVLAELRASLEADPQHTVALIGMGGLGKTQLAIEYAYAFQSAYPGGVFWVQAREDLATNEDYARVGNWFVGMPDAPTRERVMSVRRRLDQLTQPTLLVFDNVLTAEHLHLRPQNPHCHTVITTRERAVGRQLGTPLPVPDLDVASAARLLQTYRAAAGDGELQAIRDIVGMLGNLALALALVAHHVTLLDIDFVSYRRRIGNNPLKTLETARSTFVAATGHDSKVYETISLSYQSLSEESRRLLKAASCFSGDSISQHLLFAASGQPDMEAFSDLIASLTNSSLVKQERTATGEAPPRLTLHELFRVFAQHQMDAAERGETVSRVAQALADCFRQANQARSWRVARTEVPHAAAALELCRTCDVRDTYQALLCEMAVYLRENGEFQAAIARFTELKQITVQIFGHQSAEYARGLLDLGESWLWARQYDTALTILNEGLSIAQILFMPDAPEIVDFHTNIGYAFTHQHKRRLALMHYRKALRLSKKAQGKSHEMVAMCLNNLAGLHEAFKDYKAALRLYHEALPIYKAACGSEDVLVARCLNNIGRVLTKALAPSEALAFHDQALAIYHSIHGKDHLFVADTHFFMGDAFLAIGQHEQARQHYIEAQPIYARYEGVDSSTYLKLMERLAKCDEQPPHPDSDEKAI